MNVTLYQTLQDRRNPQIVEEKGPFACTTPSAWLGHGYYFWDTHEELGHWWGQTVHGNNYMICHAKCIMDNSCWDLHGNGAHRIEFEDICNEMVDAKIATKDQLLVPQVIEFLKKQGLFTYQAIRALGTNSLSAKLADNYVIFRMHFKKGKAAFLDLKPPVQVCLINKMALSLTKYRVIYPYYYLENYA